MNAHITKNTYSYIDIYNIHTYIINVHVRRSSHPSPLRLCTPALLLHDANCLSFLCSTCYLLGQPIIPFFAIIVLFFLKWNQLNAMWYSISNDYLSTRATFALPLRQAVEIMCFMVYIMAYVIYYIFILYNNLLFNCLHSCPSTL